MNTIKNEQKVIAKNLFEELFEITPEGIALLDIGTFTFVKCNNNASKLLKYSSEKLNGMGPGDISPEFQPDSRRSDEKSLEMVLEAVNKRETVFEWLTINGEGRQFMAEVRLVSLLRIGKPWIYASFVDITERKEQEMKIMEQNKKLRKIAFLQSHQVRQPIANLLGLISLFNFDNTYDPINADVMEKLKMATAKFDDIIKSIVDQTHQIRNEKQVLDIELELVVT